MSNHATVKDRIKEGERRNRKLALSHYENFIVAAWFLPKRLKQDLYNVYAFCRIADDFADETSVIETARSSLDLWESTLKEAACAEVQSPVFSALGDTIQRRRLSLTNFQNLLQAFRQDLTVTRYESLDDLLEYARYSANPVGRIVLEIYDYRNAEFFALSDKICTALQLANHWQDVAEDYQRGRIYIPVEHLNKFNLTEDFFKDPFSSEKDFKAFQELLAFEIEHVKKLFKEGFSLISKVRRPLRNQLKLYWHGGMKALEVIKRNNFDVFRKKVKLNRQDKFSVLIKGVF